MGSSISIKQKQRGADHTRLALKRSPCS